MQLPAPAPGEASAGVPASRVGDLEGALGPQVQAGKGNSCPSPLGLVPEGTFSSLITFGLMDRTTFFECPVQKSQLLHLGASFLLMYSLRDGSDGPNAWASGLAQPWLLWVFGE